MGAARVGAPPPGSALPAGVPAALPTLHPPPPPSVRPLPAHALREPEMMAVGDREEDRDVGPTSNDGVPPLPSPLPPVTLASTPSTSSGGVGDATPPPPRPPAGDPHAKLYKALDYRARPILDPPLPDSCVLPTAANGWCVGSDPSDAPHGSVVWECELDRGYKADPDERGMSLEDLSERWGIGLAKQTSGNSDNGRHTKRRRMSALARWGAAAEASGDGDGASRPYPFVTPHLPEGQDTHLPSSDSSDDDDDGMPGLNPNIPSGEDSDDDRQPACQTARAALSGSTAVDPSIEALIAEARACSEASSAPARCAAAIPRSDEPMCDASPIPDGDPAPSPLPSPPPATPEGPSRATPRADAIVSAMRGLWGCPGWHCPDNGLRRGCESASPAVPAVRLTVVRWGTLATNVGLRCLPIPHRTSR